MVLVYITSNLGQIPFSFNIQPFKGRSQVGSDPSHFTAGVPPPPCGHPSTSHRRPNISSSHLHVRVLMKGNKRRLSLYCIASQSVAVLNQTEQRKNTRCTHVHWLELCVCLCQGECVCVFSCVFMCIHKHVGLCLPIICLCICLPACVCVRVCV